jgi:large subunit ribosomal protein L30e
MSKMDSIKDIKDSLKNKTAIIGTENSMKMLKSGKVKVIYVTSNIPADVEASVMQYSKIAGIEAIKISMPNDELGMICKKPFPISVLSIKKV